MIATLGISGAPDATARDVLLDRLRGERALLIIDNCEHLLDPIAELVAEVLAAGAGLVVLATSREPLRIPGERVVSVGSLPIESDAVRLFVERARDAGSWCSLDGEYAEVIRRICSQLDGMPLAIELAAARTTALAPSEIEDHLGQRFRLLVSRRRVGDERHRSLQRVLDWSYELLKPEQQTFFVRLSIFAGRFDLEAAHQVCWPDDELATIDILDDLVAKSLLIAQRHGRRTTYLMLETMRQYSSQRLTPAERERLADRHAEFYADLGERSWDGIRGEHYEAWLARIDDNLDNIRAAFDHALAEEQADRATRLVAGLFMYNHTRRLPEIFAWLERTLAIPRTADHRLARHARLHRACALNSQHRLPDAEVEARAVLDANPADDDPLRPLGLTLLASVVGNRGRVAEMDRLSTDALALATTLGPGHEYDRSEARWQLCCAALYAGAPDVQGSIEYLDAALHSGNARALAGGLIHRGCSHPDPELGTESLAEARELTTRTRDSFRYGIATVWLGVLRCTIDPVGALEMIPESSNTSARLVFVCSSQPCVTTRSDSSRSDAMTSCPRSTAQP